MQFWKQHTVENFKLSTPLGECIHPTHRVWEWYYNKEGSSLQQRTSSGTCFYVPAAGYNRTRSGKYHVRSWESDESPEGCLISVKTITETKVLLRKTEPTMVVPQPDTHSFWEFLDSRGREWMWENVGCGKGLQWTW